jgi:NTE family protein
MTVTGLERMSKRVVSADLGLKLPAEVEVDDIEKGIDRVYGSGFFERVGYRLDGYPDSTTLGISVVEKSQNLFRVGLRFDTRTEGSLILNTTFRNILLRGALLALDLRFASDYEFEIRHALQIGFMRSLGIQTRLNASRLTIDIYENQNQVATYRSKYSFGQIVLGSVFSHTLALVGGVRADYIESEPAIGNPEFPSVTDKLIPITLGALIDTWDHAIYPTGGVLVEAVAERSFAELGNTEDFTRLYLDWRSVIPVGRKTGLLLSFYYGTSEGELPFVYHYALGGVHTPWTLLGLENSFMGLKPQQRIGPNIQAASLGVQYEFVSQVFGQLRYSVGNTLEDRNIKLESGRYISGVGLTLGARILTGRAEITFSTSEVEDFLTHVTIGSAF